MSSIWLSLQSYTVAFCSVTCSSICPDISLIFGLRTGHLVWSVGSGFIVLCNISVNSCLFHLGVLLFLSMRSCVLEVLVLAKSLLQKSVGGGEGRESSVRHGQRWICSLVLNASPKILF